MFIVPQDWFIDSKESVITISVIICATGYIITVWVRHLIRRRIDQRIIRDAESEGENRSLEKTENSSK